MSYSPDMPAPDTPPAAPRLSDAEMLYGTPAAPAAAPPVRPSDAEVLYGSPPAYVGDDGASDAVKAERAADPSRALYSPQKTYAAAIPDALLEDGLDVQAAREVAADMGAHPDEVKQLLGMPAAESDAQADQWLAQSRALGLSQADIQRAQRFVQRDPRLADFLNRTGLGNHPKVVQMAVELSRRARR
jgi:hypothetical protein